MTRRERLIATLRGEAVDRPAVNFYEIGGGRVDPSDPDEFNIYNDPSWKPLLDLAEERTDLIRMRAPDMNPGPRNCGSEFFSIEHHTQNGSRFTRQTLRIGGKTMTSLARRDRDVNTVWTLEHLLKTSDDLRTYLTLPDDAFAFVPDVTRLVEEERNLGEMGIVMLDTPDPICVAAELFSMQDFLVVGFTESELFHHLLEKVGRYLYPRVEAVSRTLPGHLWRICGAEYATEPYLPPALFEEFVVRYTEPLVRSIQRHGGFARIHCHGRIRSALPLIAGMKPDALDPIEPPPQGDVELEDVRREYGRGIVLFGNIEIADIENLERPAFERKVRGALEEGTSGKGRGFVLMPSACRCGRHITGRTMANYETMVRLATQ